ncbi:Processing of GAS1 and ALP protein 2 [Candida viswanathii]|uniref:Processing of GAS1 and ALP protein 2 n=1 Tax=Candida viswanathii TaxID=5486 RepID=A0A367XYX2_9ASCO|nr:Processing of GAS1 and ALP protein 2 [Candida viswanathii]
MAAFDEIFDYVDKDAFFQYFRLFLVVCTYLIFRKYYSAWAVKKQTQAQYAQDERELAEKSEREAREKKETIEKLEGEAQEFGWGKKTRKNVKLTEAVLQEYAAEQRQRKQTAYDAQEDADIEDLLED